VLCRLPLLLLLLLDARLTGASLLQSVSQSSRWRTKATVVMPRRPRTALSLTVLVILSQLSLLASATPVSAAGQRLQQLGRSQFPFCLFVYLFI